jgi:hypothetical protein
VKESTLGLKKILEFRCSIFNLSGSILKLSGSILKVGVSIREVSGSILKVSGSILKVSGSIPADSKLSGAAQFLNFKVNFPHLLGSW